MAGKINAALRITGYPVIQLMTLCETGTRALIGAMFGSLADGELAWACKLLHLLDEPMLVLMDRGFDAGEFLADVAATKAQFLVRLTATRQPPVLRHLPNGSFTSLVDVGGEGPDCRRIGHRHLPRRHPVRRCVPTGHHPARSSRLPAHVLMALHHERWEHEITYLTLRHTCSRAGCCARTTQSAWNRRSGRSRRCTTSSKFLRAGVGLPDERVKQDGRCGGHPAVRADGRGESPAQSGVINVNGTQACKHLAADG
jgi:hypothetical protein